MSLTAAFYMSVSTLQELVTYHQLITASCDWRSARIPVRVPISSERCGSLEGIGSNRLKGKTIDKQTNKLTNKQTNLNQAFWDCRCHRRVHCNFIELSDLTSTCALHAVPGIGPLLSELRSSDREVLETS